MRHMSQPSEIKMIYKEKKYNVRISIDSGYLSAIIENGKAHLPLSRYEANSGYYNSEKYKLLEYTNNKTIINDFVRVLKEILESDDIYFYIWEGNKRYKMVNGKKEAKA